MKLVLVIFLAIVAMISSGSFVYAANADPFNLETQKFLITWTADQMHVKNKECIPKFTTLRAEQIPDDEFNQMAGFDTKGKRYNFFYPPDKIILVVDNENHNLVHEIVHFLQYNCQNQRDGTSDLLEQTAVDIQRQYQGDS